MFTQANVSFSAPWGTGLIGQINVSNNAQLINNWTITFEVPFQIVNIWNASILTATSLGNGGMRYVVGSAGWNDAVPPNGAVSFGFEGRAASNIQAQLSGITFGTGAGLATPPSVTINDATIMEGASGTKEMVFTIALSKAATEAVTIPWSAQDGTAQAGSDYRAASGSLSFAPGETSKTIAVTILGDTLVEGNESFNLVLGTPGGATIADGTGLGTIQNDDVLPILSIADAQASEGNAGTKLMVFTVTLSEAALAPVTLAYTTRDGTALAGSDYDAATGSLSFAVGETSKTITVALRGDTVDEIDESFEIALSGLTGASFARSSARGTILNDDVPPVITLSNAEILEGATGTRDIVFTLTLNKASAETVTAGFATQDGTALAGSDYVARSGTVSFAAGETSKTISVTVNGDSAIELDETFNLVLSNVTRATLAGGGGVGTIRNDDLPPPTLTISDAQVTEGDAGTKQMLFTVALSRAATSAVSVGYATQAGTATSGSDFTATTGTLSFAAGETSKTIVVTVQGDTAVEADETFNLLLSNPAGATIADGTGLGTILNDDVAPTLAISDAQLAEGQAGSAQMLFTVTLSRAAGSPVSVSYATQAGTASSGSDFTATSGTLSFAAGETSKTIGVTVQGDAAVEANETFNLVLSGATGATIADGTGVGTILNDDVAAPAPSGDTASFRVTQSWFGGFLADITLVNDATPIEGGWTLAFDAPFQIKNIWNAEIVSQSGSHYVIRNAPWNGNLGPLGTTSFGIDVAGSGEPANFSVNGAAPPPALPGLSIADAFLTEGDAGAAMMNFTVSLSAAASEALVVQYGTADGSALTGLDYQGMSGSLTFAPGETSKILSFAVLGDTQREGTETFTVNLTAPGGARLLDGSALGTILDNDGSGSTLPPAGWYSTSGNQIVDSTGETVRLKGVNWFGMEGFLGVPDGLYARNWQDMMEQMKEVGFDTIRLPFSLQNIQPGAMPNNIVYGLNPDLVGLSNLQVLDKIVDYAGELGMKIILDCHRSSSGNGPNENGLWYDQNFSEAQWINGWKSLVQRYAGDSTVIGVDLQNEPHATTWTDWSAAAERAGNAIHEVNPNLLVIVEGVGNYQGDYYWWGGQLEGVQDDPVVLQQANKLVYSPHDYPYTVYPNSWLDGPGFKDNLPNVFREHWGFIYEQGIAPIFLGEFGTRLTDPRDIAWLDELTQYINGDFDTNGVLDIAAGQEGMSFAYWSWNPNSTDTGGILMDDWINVHQNKLVALDSILGG
jgi:chitinase